MAGCSVTVSEHTNVLHGDLFCLIATMVKQNVILLLNLSCGVFIMVIWRSGGEGTN